MGVKCWSRFVFFLVGVGGGGVLSPRDFLRFPFLPPFDHPCHLRSGVLPPPPGVQHQNVTKTRNEHEERENEKWKMKNGNKTYLLDGCQSNRADFDH